MYLVYSCVFFQWNYINLLNLLLKSYALTDDKKDIIYLVICHPKFEEHINNLFESLNIEGKVWCMDLNTFFEAGYSRLFIFDYIEIEKYKKILYLDVDILVSDSLTKILSNELEDKLYAIEEGNTNTIYHGSQFFGDSNPNIPAFTSGMLLFNNCETIKKLFNDIIIHIKGHLSSNKPIPCCLDQPFIVYNSITQNLYDNKLLCNFARNNPDETNGLILSHFCCGPGNYPDKMKYMTTYFKNHILKDTIYENDYLCKKKYTWQNSVIEFLPNGKMNAFGPGTYKYISTTLVKGDFGGREHFLRFSEDYKTFISIRKDDFASVKGHLI